MTKNLSKALLLLLLISAIVVAVSGCVTSPTVTPTPAANVTATPAPISTNFTTLTPGTLKVATEAAWGPFEWINSSDPDPQTRFVGFDMDLMREIGHRLNKTVVFVDQPFSGIITAVQTKQFDAGISSFSVTPERQQTIDFSDPYYQIQQSILIRNNDSSITGASDLANKSKIIGAQSGTTGEMTAKDLVGTANETRVKTYEHVTDVFPALQNGQVDAVVNDYPVSQYYADSPEYKGQFKFVGQLFPTKEPYAIVINKENTQLTKAINDALAQIKADGTYDKLLKQYGLDKIPA